jgi:hypothetical protein
MTRIQCTKPGFDCFVPKATSDTWQWDKEKSKARCKRPQAGTGVVCHIQALGLEWRRYTDARLPILLLGGVLPCVCILQ